MEAGKYVHKLIDHYIKRTTDRIWNSFLKWNPLIFLLTRNWIWSLLGPSYTNTVLSTIHNKMSRIQFQASYWAYELGSATGQSSTNRRSDPHSSSLSTISQSALSRQIPNRIYGTTWIFFLKSVSTEARCLAHIKDNGINPTRLLPSWSFCWALHLDSSSGVF